MSHKGHHVNHVMAKLVLQDFFSKYNEGLSISQLFNHWSNYKNQCLFFFVTSVITNHLLALHSCLLCRSGPVALQRCARASHLIDPKLSDNDVVHRGGNFLPRVVIIALLKDCMNCACEEEKKNKTTKKAKQNLCSSVITVSCFY